MKCLELQVEVFALCHRPWLKHGDRVKMFCFPNARQCALAVPQMSVGNALISMLAPSLGLSWWWASEDQVTTQKEIQYHSEIQQEEVTKFPLSSEPCLPGLPYQIRARERVFGLSNLSQSCLDSCKCIRIGRDSPGTDCQAYILCPWVMSSDTESFELFIITPLPPSAFEEMLPLGSTLMTHISTVQSLHGLETNCPSETQWLVLTRDERLNQAGCVHRSAQCSAEEIMFIWLQTCHLVFDCIVGMGLRCSYFWSPGLGTWCHFFYMKISSLTVHLEYNFSLCGSRKRGIRVQWWDIQDSVMSWGTNASYLHWIQGHEWLQGLLENAKLNMKALGAGPDSCAAMITAFPFSHSPLL